MYSYSYIFLHLGLFNYYLLFVCVFYMLRRAQQGHFGRAQQGLKGVTLGVSVRSGCCSLLQELSISNS